MFELFLNAARFAASDDAKESISSIVDLIRHLPEWEKSICTLQANVAGFYAEQAMILKGLTTSKLENLSFPPEAIEAFETIYSELVSNAFEHGCATKRDKVKIIIDITEWFVALLVINSKKNSFDLDKTLANRKYLMSKNPYLKRGRGLILVSDLADTLEELYYKNGVKTVVYRNRVSFNVDVIDDLTIIEIVGGVHNPSLRRRLINLATQHIDNNLILDFSRFASRWKWQSRTQRRRLEDSASSRVALELSELFSEANKKVVALMGYDNPIAVNDVSHILPNSLVADSLGEALEKIYSTHLLKKIRARIKRFRPLRRKLVEKEGREPRVFEEEESEKGKSDEPEP